MRVLSLNEPYTIVSRRENAGSLSIPRVPDTSAMQIKQRVAVLAHGVPECGHWVPRGGRAVDGQNHHII